MPKRTTAILVSLWCAAALGAQTDESLDTWVRNRIEAKIAGARATSDKLLVEANSNRVIRQKEAPSGDARSTSLVDESSATDFLSVALALAPTATGTSATQGSNGSGVVTATAYSLLALLNKKSLTDPEFYKSHTMARQLSFSLGSASSEKDRDNTDQAGTVVGFKYTFLNGRDIYTRRNQERLSKLQGKFSTVTPVETKVKDTILSLLFCAEHAGREEFARFCAAPDTTARVPALDEAIAKFRNEIQPPASFAAMVKRVPEGTLNQVDLLIEKNLETFASLREMINATYDQIKQGRQLAITATYVNRPELGTDDFHSALVFDYGLAPRLNWTVNGSFDHRDRKVGFDTRGGRFATEFLSRLTSYGDDLWGRQPITLAFAGEGKWLTKQKPQYSAQAKVTIPIAAGLDLPIVYRWAKRIDLVDKQGKELKLGLTVDLGNLSQMLKSR